MKNHGRGTTERVRSCVKRAFLGGMYVRISLINLVIILFILGVGFFLGGKCSMPLHLTSGSFPLPFRTHRTLVPGDGPASGLAQGR